MSFLQEAKQRNFIAKVQNVADFPLEQLQLTKFIVLILSTYGEGGPTYDAEKFLDYLSSDERQKDQLKNLEYVIFGLGNKSYENFCGMGVKTDALLQKLGAKNLYKLGKGDANDNTTDKDFQEWKKSTWPVLESRFKEYEISQQALLEQQLPFDLKFLPVEKQHEFALNNRRILNAQQYQQGLQDYLKTPFMTVKQLTQISQPSKDNSPCYFIDLEIAETDRDQLQYQTAGNVSIYPENDDSSVSRFSKLMGYNPEQFFEITMKNSSLKKPIPTPLKVKTYLKKFCDFYGKLNKMQLSVLLDHVEDPQIKESLQLYTTYEGEDLFISEITEKQHSLFSLCELYKIRLPLEQLILISERIRPRNYTISSSSKVHPHNIHLTVTLSKRGQELGVMSQQWSEIQKVFSKTTDPIQLKVGLVSSPFVMKQDKIPNILVATGAGIAPMRALWQEKSLSKGSFGDMILYFGCRKKTEDYIYEAEIQDNLKKGVISNLRVAFSREG